MVFLCVPDVPYFSSFGSKEVAGSAQMDLEYYIYDITENTIIVLYELYKGFKMHSHPPPKSSLYFQGKYNNKKVKIH